ncbi:MAG: hypothetical protein Q4D51_13750 [Eubacteriales bacterium]|nr:hypothetical protein [Eubacteriales bacterium]
MEVIEALVIGGLCGLASIVLIGNNYYRIFNYYRKNPKKVTGSPVYLLGGILGVIAVLCFLSGDDLKSKWYYCLIPIALDWGLFVVALLFSIFAPPRKEDIVENESEEEE